MAIRHELIELEPGPRWQWMVRCSCGWKEYFVRDAFKAANLFFNHTNSLGDCYSWDEMEAEWQAGYDIGRDAGREELIDELNKLKEAADGSNALPST